MALQHPNFSRNMVKQFLPYLASSNPELAPIWNVLGLAKKAQKFMLPEGGRLYDDRSLRALDENEPLRLPFPVIALEYHSDTTKQPADGELLVSRKIVFAREEADKIVMTIVVWMDRDQQWYPFPEAALPLTGYLNRNVVSADGYVSIVFHAADPRVPMSDYGDELGALLCFINALQCSNVHIERSEAKKPGKKIKAALPFDDYYVLDVDMPGKSALTSASGTHRSPREHLRRGHIRRLESGKRIWVNAAVIGAGKGAGKIFKDYNVKS